MLKVLPSLLVLSLLASNCGSSSDAQGVAAGGSGYTVGRGGFGASVAAGANSGGDGSVGTSLSGGISQLTDSLAAQIDAPSCAAWSSVLAVAPALLEFVIDVSGSMSDTNYAGSNGQSKWQVTRDALSSAINTGLPNNTGVGMLLFPNMNTTPNANLTPLAVDQCINASAMIAGAPLGSAGSAQRALIAEGLAGASAVGGTPTDDAYQLAYGSGVLPALQNYRYFTPFIVLLTDGQPTFLAQCEGTGLELYPVDWHPIVNDVGSALAGTLETTLTSHAVGAPVVKTFVIGAPGSDASSTTGSDCRPWLSQAATAGGTPRTPGCQNSGPNFCHYDMSQSTDFAADLATVLGDIVEAAIPCSFQIPAPSNRQPIDFTKLNVIYDENVVGGQPTQQWLIGQTTDTSCASGTGDGWFLDANQNIVLCATTCEAVQADKYAQLEVRGGCQPIAPLPT